MSNLTREKIKEAAKTEFSKNGYHSTSVSDIISSIGMAQGTFYHYFKNKRSLFEELLQDFVTMLVDKLNNFDFDKIKDTGTYISTGYFLGSSIIESFMENRSLAIIFLREAVGIDEGLSKIIDQGYSDVVNYTIKHIEYGQNLGIVTKDFSREVMAMSMVGTSVFMINRHLIGDLKDFDIDVLIEEALQVHLRGVLAKN